MGKTSAEVKNRYAAKAYDRIILQVKKGHKDEIKAAADTAGESLNGYITRAVEQRMAAPPPMHRGRKGAGNPSE